MFNFSFRNKDNEFFELFAKSADLFHEGALVLHDGAEDHAKLKQKMEEIATLEHAADDINDEIIDKLNQTFITPIDREDIYALATRLDDGVDYIQETLQRMVLYRTGEASVGSIDLTRILVDCTAELVKAFNLIKNIKGNQQKILEFTQKIKVLESEGDKIYRKELACLFETCNDPIEIIKWKEILEHFEECIDHCEDIADLLRGVVMKYA